MLYIVDGVFEFTRTELIEWLKEIIIENGYTREDIWCWFPNQDLDRTLYHSAVRITRALGFKIECIH